MSKILKEILRANGLTPSSDKPNEQGGENKPSGEAAGEGKAGGENDDKNTDTDAGGQSGQSSSQQDPPAGTEGTGNASGTPPVTADDDIDEARLLAALAKKGHKLNSLADLNKPEPPKELTPEEKAAAEQARQDSIRAFGLRTKKVTSTQFDNYVRDTSVNPVELGYRLFKEERLAELKAANTPADQMPDEKALRDEFDETHFQFAEEKDPKRIRSEKLLKQQVDRYIEDRYANILDLEEEYDSHQQISQRRNEYNKRIDTVLSQVGEEMQFDIPDDKNTFSFKFKIPAELRNDMRAAYTNDTSFSVFGQNNVKDEAILQAIKGNIIQKAFPQILQEAIAAHSSQKIDALQKGRRGIPPERKDSGSEGGEKKQSKVLQEILNQPENKRLLQTQK